MWYTLSAGIDLGLPVLEILEAIAHVDDTDSGNEVDNMITMLRGRGHEYQRGRGRGYQRVRGRGYQPGRNLDGQGTQDSRD